MQSLPELLQQGTANAWLFVPAAILLGALHGLEPGHSKTMMAAFIIAIRGTVAQAVLLGLSAALSHTAVVWVVAIGGQYLGQNLDAETAEPYLQLVSAVIIIFIALWVFRRTRRELVAERAGHHAHPHGHTHDSVHDHHHNHGHHHHNHGHHHHHHDHRHALSEAEHCHEHEHSHGAKAGLRVVESGAFVDAHERTHADEISRRFRDRKVSTAQIILFGLTGGLIPCPAAITVLLLCLQLKQLSLGVALVACFSIGLAVTMVSVGVIASLSVSGIRKRWSGFDALARRAPYASAALMLLVAAYMAVSGWIGMSGGYPFG